MINYYGDNGAAVACGEVRTEQPFDFQPWTLIFRQRFTQVAKNYAPLPIGTPYPPLVDPGSPAQATPTGTWEITHRGIAHTTTPLPPFATAAQIQAAMIGFPQFTPNKLVVTGNWNDGYLFDGAGGATGLGTANGGMLVCWLQALTPAYVYTTTILSAHDETQMLRITNASTAGAITVGAVLVQETTREDQGNGTVEWDRVYAKVPSAYVEYDSYNYQLQRYTSFRIPWNGYNLNGVFIGVYRTFYDITEFNEPLTATIAYAFCDEWQLGGGPFQFHVPFRIIHGFDSFGNEFVYIVGQGGIAEATSAKRWMGNLWKVKNVFVKPY